MRSKTLNANLKPIKNRRIKGFLQEYICDTVGSLFNL